MYSIRRIGLMINPIKKTRHIKKKMIIAVGTFVVLLGVAAIYFVYKNRPTTPATTPTTQKPINYTPPTNDEKTAGDQIKKQELDSQKQTSDGSNNTPSTVPLVITSTSQSSGMVYIRVIIQEVTSTGSCTLSMSNSSGGTYTATSPVQSMASSSTCEGFNVPVSKLSQGSWDINIKYTNGTSSGVASGSITIQ